MAKLVSKVYGDALFAAARETQKMDRFYDDAKWLLEVFRNNPKLEKLLDSAKVVKEDKEKMIEDTFSEGVSKEIVGLLRLLVAKGHQKDIQSVLEYFILCVKEERQIGIAYVTTAVDLTDAQKEAVEKKLLETTEYTTFEMNYSCDPSLIGGMIIRIKDRVVDSSIRTKLYDLSRNLKNIQLSL